MNNQVYPKNTNANKDGYALTGHFTFNEDTSSKFLGNNALTSAWSDHFNDRICRSESADIQASHKGESDAMKEFTDSANLRFDVTLRSEGIADYAFWVEMLKTGHEVAKVALKMTRLNPVDKLGMYVYENVKVVAVSALKLDNVAQLQFPEYRVSFSATKMTILDGSGIELTTITASRHANLLKG